MENEFAASATATFGKRVAVSDDHTVQESTSNMATLRSPAAPADDQTHADPRKVENLRPMSNAQRRERGGKRISATDTLTESDVTRQRCVLLLLS